MINMLNKPELCSGCTACASICPVQAIYMEENANGFLYPRINLDKCIDCKLCEKVCDFKQFQSGNEVPKCYAVRHKKIEEYITSRSGGFFMVLCQKIIDDSGVVYGCTLNDDLSITHERATNYEECKRFKGSKYVQSDLRDSFVKVEHDLINGKKVLFSGTGCQVHGLLSYLSCRKVNVDNLITVDIVCHGVPSPGVWKKYINIFEEKRNKKIVAVDFRDKKTFGWKEHIETYLFDDGEIINTRQWADVFYRHIMFRESCYNCKYTTISRRSDYTIADYWGIKNNAPEFDDNKGCSLVLIHTEKGKMQFELLKKLVDWKETQIENSMQPQLQKPIWKGIGYSSFWKKYKRNNKKAICAYFFPNIIIQKYNKYIKKIRRAVKRMIIRIIR